MFVNSYDVTLETFDGSNVTVSLRLGAGAQMELKKRWKESTTQTIFEAADDIERFVDVMDKSLNWNGNQNPIHKGEELVDLMAGNGMLGMTAKQQVLTSIGLASGLFSAEEKAKIDEKTSHMFDDILGGNEGEDGKNP